MKCIEHVKAHVAAIASTLDRPARQEFTADLYYQNKEWQRSREWSAYEMLTGGYSFRSSEDWCEVFGCCGRGWYEQQDELAFGELKAAHLAAGLLVPAWIADRQAFPARRLTDPEYKGGIRPEGPPAAWGTLVTTSEAWRATRGRTA